MQKPHRFVEAMDELYSKVGIYQVWIPRLSTVERVPAESLSPVQPTKATGLSGASGPPASAIGGSVVSAVHGC